MTPPRALCLVALLLVTSCTSPLRLDEEHYRSRTYAKPDNSAAFPGALEVVRDEAPLDELTLPRARDLALSRNHSVRAAAATVDAARARISEARAAFLPTLSGRIQREANREKTTISIPGGPSFEISPSTRTTASGRFAVSLFAFGRDREAVQAARANLATEILGERGVRQALLLEVTRAWYRLHETQAQVKVAEDAVEASERELEDARNLVRAGRSTKDTELTAQVQWLQRRQDLIVGNNAVTHARRVLNVLLVRGVDAPTSLAPPPAFRNALLNTNRMVALAHRHNPALLAYRSQRQALEHGRTSVERSLLPEFVGAVDAAYSDFRQATGFSTNYTAMIAAEWTPLNAGRRIGKLEEIHANLVGLREQELAALETLELDIKRAVLDIVETESAVALARQSIAAAEENYRIISEQFRNGKLTARERLEAQATLSNARFSYNQGRFGHRILLSSLEALIGVAESDWAKFKDPENGK